jgi:hypothetical protein
LPDHLLYGQWIGYEERPCFGTEEEMVGPTRPYRICQTPIFVRCNLSANNIYDLCDAVSRAFGYGPFTVTLR